MISSWLPSFDSQCPDVALQAYTEMTDENKLLPRILIWVGMLVSLEQAWHATTLLMKAKVSDLTVSIGISPRFHPPLLTTLLWVVFTAVSIFLIGITFRSNAAVLSKTLHVTSEASF